MTSDNKTIFNSELSDIELISELLHESDRTSVILGAAKIDILLYQLLIKFLLPNPTSRDDLFDGDSPLSTLSSKINLCFRLGLIDSGTSKALHLIRKIRNSFAHEISGCQLDVVPHKDRVKELVSPYENEPTFIKMKSISEEKGKRGPSADFRILISLLILFLQEQLNEKMALKQIEELLKQYEKS